MMNTRKLLAIVLTASCGALFAGEHCSAGTQAADPAPAAGTQAPAQAPVPVPAPDPSMTAEAFAQAVAEADLLQISLGTLAAQNADAQAVKDIGRRMVTNHNAIQVIIGKIGARQGVTLPSAMSGEDRAVADALAAKKGVEFDKAYMMLLAERHPKTLAMFRWQYENCTNAELKSFAAQTMPIIGTHTRISDALNQVINKEELRLAAEQKAAELRAAEQARAEEAAAAAAAAAKKRPAKKPLPKKPMGAS